ncbi:peptidylprolyl isomerase [Candidatus Nitrosacidococcus tergens]|uniref:Peptidyl-prolyl cis-trans isomerase n=1 Tax=Candidatus Nitrosacidococcus tergens TaxID=553981 RepID=A0A7G1Q8I8_9GAMM|nr:peptidylprolyl isomerase [Candidatus Nitrosacidococcus tergens]CAB1275179.1 peptidyl-prolyl cis-trans isomerase precursor (PPIase) (Rotamase) [Candidatus Nitrosacidococcus tergens]
MHILQRTFIFLLLGIFGLTAEAAGGSSSLKSSPHVKLETNLGDIIIELNPEKAPISVKNFLNYVNEGFYNGTIFHRVIKNFMIQGGGFDETFNQKSTNPSIQNEADNGLANEIGTIAMARTPDPNSATAQFFINTADNKFLNFQSKTAQGWGYAVFGKVTEGMDIVRAIENTPTGRQNGYADVPLKQIVIQQASVIN